MKPYYEQSYWDSLFSWKELEYLINIRPLMSASRVNILGDEPGLKWQNTEWTKDYSCLPPSLLREVLDNYIVFISDMSRSTKNINDFAKMLEKEYGFQADAHIYICMNTSIKHHFGTQFDYNDNVIVQCEGETNWKVWDEVTDTRQQRYVMDIKDDPIIDVNMKPGDTIWIPKNYPHRATSNTVRLSVSFPLAHHRTYSYEDYFEDRNWVNLY